MDDAAVASTPTLGVSPGTLSGFTATYPSAGAAKNFDITGANLTEGVSVALDATGQQSYEIKKSTDAEASYSSSTPLSLTAAQAMAGVTVNVRLKANVSPGSGKGGTVTVSGGGASTSPTVTLSSGTVSLAAPTVTITGHGVDSISGTVSGTEGGATVVLKRYGESTDADAGTPTGADGQTVTVTSGAFADSGLLGCKTYYYRAWQQVGGVWSDAGSVSQDTDDIAVPHVTATAGNGEATFAWSAGYSAVAGAAIKLSVWTQDGESSDVTDTLDVTALGLTSGSGYETFSGVSDDSDAVYSGKACYDNGGKIANIQLAANKSCGIYTTTSGGRLKSVSVEWKAHNGNSLLVYGKTGNTPFSGVGDASSGTAVGTGTLDASTTTVTAPANSSFTHVLIVPSGLVNVKSLTIVWEEGAAPDYLEDYPAAGTTVTLPVTVEDLTNDTEYHWKVTAQGGTCSEEATGTVTPEEPDELTVAAGSATGVGKTGATIGGTVTSAAGETLNGGGVMYSLDGTKWWTAPLTSAPTEGTAFSVALTGLEPNTTYQWKAYATTSEGSSAESAVSSFTTMACGVGTVPSVSATAVRDTSADFEWTDVAGATGYLLRVWTGVAAGRVVDTLTAADFAAASTTYTVFSGVQKNTAVWEGKSAKNGAGAIQLNSSNPNGIWTTTSGGTARTVIIKWGTGMVSGHVVKIYGKATAYASGNLYAAAAATKGTEIGSATYDGTSVSTTVTLSPAYPYIGIRSTSGALYIDSVSVEWSPAAGATYVTGYGPAGASIGTGVEEATASGLTAGTTHYWSLTATDGTCEETATGSFSTKSLGVSPGSLSGFSTTYGAASAAQTLTVTAANLETGSDGNVTVTAPTGYEVSKTSASTGYAGSVTLSKGEAEAVGGATVWVRLKSDATPGTVSGTLTVANAYATTVNVDLTGTMTASDGVEFPGDWNSWLRNGSTIADANFGGGAYYYTPAAYLTADQWFKAHKGGNDKGNGYWLTGNNAGQVFTVNDNTANLKLCVTETGGGFTPTGAGYYTLRGWDTGSGIQYVAMYTAEEPVEVTAVSDNHAAAGTAAVTVTATLSDEPSTETVYLRYSTDGGSTYTLAAMTVSGTTATGTIPARGKGTAVQYYVMTSPHAAVETYPDLCTLRGKRDTEGNFAYTVAVADPTAVTATAGYETAHLGWSRNAAGENVMVVRYAGSGPEITAPSDNRAYAAGDPIGAGTVVCAAGPGPSADTTVSQGTTYTFVFYSVNGSGGSSKYSGGVAAEAVTSKTLGTPTLGLVSGTWTLDGALNGETYVVVRTGSGETAGTPAGSATVPAAGQTWCGGKVVYAGTSETFTDSQAMTACETYSYRPYLKATGEEIWAAGSVSADTVQAAAPETPAVTSTSSTADSITINWSAGEGPAPTGYTLGVTTVSTGSGNYKLVKSASGFTAGEYIIVGGSSSYAMNNSGSTYLGRTSVTIDDDTILAADVTDAIKWTIAANSTSDGWTIYNAAEEKYVNPRSSSQNTLNFGSLETNSWTLVGVNSETHIARLSNRGNSEYSLQYNSSASRFSTYKNGQSDLRFFKRDGGDTVTVFGPTGVGAVTTYTLEELDPATTYTYTLTATGASGCTSSGSATGTVGTSGVAKPTAPTLTATADGAGAMTVGVSRGNGASYVLYRFGTEADATAATTPAEAELKASATLLGDDLTGTSVTDDDLTGCTRYWYRAWEQNSDGETTVYSDASNVANAETATPGAPSVTVTGKSATGFTLNWGEVAGASVYLVNVWKLEEGTGNPMTYAGTGNFQLVTNAADMTNGVYVVGAYGASVAMSNRMSTGFYSVPVTIDAETHVIGNPGTELAWVFRRVDGTTDTYTIQNVANSQYVGWSDGTKMATNLTADTTAEQWKLTAFKTNSYGSSLLNVKAANRYLEGNGSTPSDFRAYASAPGSTEPGLLFYKLTATSIPVVEDRWVDGLSTVLTLEPGTTYYYSVQAIGGCGDGGTGTGDETTPETVARPTVTAATGSGDGEIDVEVTSCISGADVVVKRYGSQDDALADTRGTTVHSETAEGTTVSFTDDGLAGCTEYWYRAWQTTTVDGDRMTSAGSTPRGAKTTMGAPVMNPNPPIGAGTTLTLAWNPVLGADRYEVQVSTAENTWTYTTMGTAVLTEDFSAFTGSGTEVANLDALTSTSGWTGSTLFRESQTVRLGSKSASGELTTPELAALPARGGRLTFDVKGYGDKNGTLAVDVRYEEPAEGGGEATWGDWTSLTNCDTAVTDWQRAVKAEIAEGKRFQVRFQTSAQKKRAYLDNISIAPYAGGVEGTIKGEWTVTGAPLSRTLERLTTEATYWYRVRAVKDGDCGDEEEGDVWAGPTTTKGSVKIEDVPIVAVLPPSFDFGEVAVPQDSTWTFRVKNTGSEPLSVQSLTLEETGGTTWYTITGVGGATIAGTTSYATPFTVAEDGETTVTVRFAPAAGETKTATLKVRSNGYNANGRNTSPSVYGDTSVSLTGKGNDPRTAPVTVYWLDAEDGTGAQNTVTDHALAMGTPDGAGGELPGAERVTLRVLAWHYNGVATGTARWTLFDPAENPVTYGGLSAAGNAFDSVDTEYRYNNQTGTLFTATLPAFGTGNAKAGAYTVKFTATDANGEHGVENLATFTPAEQGWLLDDFSRTDRWGDGEGGLGNGWTVAATDEAMGSAAIHARRLELYGPHGDRSEVQGRIAVTRDMADRGYEKDPAKMKSMVSWGFHFQTGGRTVGFSAGSTAGAFVLGATDGDWFGADTTAEGYAVAFMNDAVSLMSFKKGWKSSGSTRTSLKPWKKVDGTWTQDDEGRWQYAGTEGKTLAVRVDFVPGQEYIEYVQDEVPPRLRLYVKEVEGTGGNPLEECLESDLVLETRLTSLPAGDLRYAGMVWTHGSAKLDETTGGAFDDLHFPLEKGQALPMAFEAVDEDTAGPAFEDFEMAVGATTPSYMPFGGAISAGDLETSGMKVRGTAHDASGLLSGTAKWGLYVDADEDGEWGEAVAWGSSARTTQGTMTLAPPGDGANAEVAVEVTINAGIVDADWAGKAACFVMEATDRDRDRASDGATGSETFEFTLCSATPAPPAWATVEADGAEMAVLRWARTEGGTYLVVRSDEEIGELETPDQGIDELTAATDLGMSGEMVYLGDGDEHLTGTWTAREFVVGEGSANYFAVYGVVHDSTGYYFSAPTVPSDWSWDGAGDTTVYATDSGTAGGTPCAPTPPAVRSNSWPVTTLKYEPGEGVDAFAYRTSVCDPNDPNPASRALEFAYPGETRPPTGHGWSGSWSGSTGSWEIHDGNLPTGETDYPHPAGNKLYWADTAGSDTSVTLTRQLETPCSGDFWVAAIVNFQYDGLGKWVNISLLGTHDGVENVELVSFGKQGAHINTAGIAVPRRITGTDDEVYDWDEGGVGSYNMIQGPGSDHVIVGQVSPTAGVFRLWGFYAGTLDPAAEGYEAKKAAAKIPQIWDDENPSTTDDAIARYNAAWGNDSIKQITAVTGIKIQAGSWSDKGTLGMVYVDEVRFASSWEDLFNFRVPEVWTYDFDKPAGSGKSAGTDEDGHKIWLVSDGALAHGDEGLNATFGLYHRTGIKEASFTIKDGEGVNTLLKTAASSGTDTTASEGGADARVGLDGSKGKAHADWATEAGGAKGVAIPTNWISLGSNYVVEVKVKSSGGKEARVTSASSTGGSRATDLFLGEFGEGNGDGEKYVEIYNGTGEPIDLHEYYIARSNPKGSSVYGGDTTWTNDYYRAKWYNWERISEVPRMMPHKSTLVLLSNKAEPDFEDALAGVEYIKMTTDVVNSGGQSVIALFRAEDIENPDTDGRWANSPTNKPWLDACGLSLASAHFIQSRLDDTPVLPRSAPDVLDPDEWDYRPWRASAADTGYTNVQATAGVYDRNIGLGGHMEFMVYDDDEQPPVLSASGTGLCLDGTLKEGDHEGTRDYVLAGWSFTNSLPGATAEDAIAPWTGSSEGASAALTCSENLGNVLRLAEGGMGRGKGVVGEFSGAQQEQIGELYFACDAEGHNITENDTAWIGFETDLERMTGRGVSFWYATGPRGFKEGHVEVSTDGVTWLAPAEWTLALDSVNGTGSASTFAEFSQSLEFETEPGVAAIPKTAGHIWFRVCVSRRTAKDGTFRMDCIQVYGTPDEVVVTDEELKNKTPAFRVKVSDAGSGVDAESAEFRFGIEGLTLARTAGSEGGYTNLTWTSDAVLTPGDVEEWLEASKEGTTHLKVSVKDTDDDRPDDQAELHGDFGLLRVEDDDTTPPEIVMTSLKKRSGNELGEWLFASTNMANAGTASKHANGLQASALRARAGDNETKHPWSDSKPYDGSNPDTGYGAYQQGWTAGTKYWYVRLETLVGTTGADGATFTVTGISFNSKVNMLNAPTACDIKLVQGVTSIDPATDKALNGTTTTLATGVSLLPSGETEWTDGTTKTWVPVSPPISSIVLGGNTVNELQIWGTGAGPKSGLARWYLHDLKITGTVRTASGEEEEATYVTDHALMADGGVGTLTGKTWDEGSGLASASYTIRRGARTVSSGAVTIENPAAVKSEGDGDFSVPLTGIVSGYSVTSILGDYDGTLTVTDADADRTSGGVNVDCLTSEGEFGFTVVDQDVMAPTAPGSVAVNGVSMAGATEPQWTNNPEFIITFTPASDQKPEAADLEAHGWIAEVQEGVTGIGEYRVVLADGTESAYPVAVTNGSLANYGFETANQGEWVCGDFGASSQSSRIMSGTASVSAPEGLKFCYLREHNEGNNWAELSQTMALPDSETARTVKVDLSARLRKGAAGSVVWFQMDFAAGTNFPPARDLAEAEAANYTPVLATTGPIALNLDGDLSGVWLEKTMATQTIAEVPPEAKFARAFFYVSPNTAYLDDLRLGVKVGDGSVAAMRYVATPAAQGLQDKSLYAVDADNDWANDRLSGEAAVFHTAYDITPPTPVEFHNTTASGSHGSGALTSEDDPTTQFDLVWVTKKDNKVVVGPDNPIPGSVYDAIPQEDLDRAERDNDVLSPWGSYKVYYRTYDPVAIEAAAAAANENTADYLYRTLVQDEGTGTAFYKDASLGWKWIQNGDKIEDPSANASGILRYADLDKVLKPGAPASVTTNGMRLYDLEYDQEYLVVISGVDAAGNEGPVTATSWATNNTIKFSLTRGWHVPKTEAVQAFSSGSNKVDDIESRLTHSVVSALQWTAASNKVVGTENEWVVTKDYDLLQWDARSFRESPDNNWKLIQTVHTNWFVDDGGPTNRGAIRFYRASYKDRWRKSVTNKVDGTDVVMQQTPLVSEEVYAQTAIPLRPGWNFVALHGVPYVNTFRAVFGGTENFPPQTEQGVGDQAEQVPGTKIDFYPVVTTNANSATEHYWLDDQGHWYREDSGEDVTDAELPNNFFNRAFSINLPDDIPPSYVAGTTTIRHGSGSDVQLEEVPYMLWKPILRVPTTNDVFRQDIICPAKANDPPMFNIVALRLPVEAHPSEMNLVNWKAGTTDTVGMTPGNRRVADQIYSFDTVTRVEKRTCYCAIEGTNLVWRFADGGGLVPGGYFKPNDVLVIISRNPAEDPAENGTKWIWEYNPKTFYTPPNRHMQDKKE